MPKLSFCLGKNHSWIFTSVIALCTVFSASAQKDWTVGVPEVGNAAINRTTADINTASANVGPKKLHTSVRRVLKDKAEFPILTGSSVTGSTNLPSPSFQFNPDIATPTVNFTGATVNDCSGYPPDTMGAVGPTQFIIALNGRIRSFNKTTGAMDNAINADTDVFFSPVMTAGSNFSSDPHIRYDRLSKRWFIVMIDVPGQQAKLVNRVMIAVSDTSIITPSTVWSFYWFAGDSSNFADYPTPGIDANALYIGANIFSTSSGNFVNCSGYVVRKSSVLNGGPIVVTKFTGLITGHSSLVGPYTPQGVDNFDPNATEGYFIGVDITSLSTIQLRRVINPAGTPSLSANISITVDPWASPINVSAQGSTTAIDGLDERLLAAHFRNGSLWTAHNVSVNSTGGTTSTDRNAVRWYQITNIPTGSTPSIVQSGTVFQSGSSALSYWMPTIMVSGQGHAAMGFSAAGPSHFLDAAATGRYASDTLGTMQTPFTYTSSSSSYNPSDGSNPHRWGDYSFTSLDPNDDMTMWTVQEWCSFSPNGFAVQVAKLPAPLPATPTSCSPTGVAANSSSVNVVLTGTSANSSGFFDPGAGFSNHIAAVVGGGGVTVNSVTYTDPTHITLNVSVAPSAALISRTITVINPDGQSASSASGIFTVLPGPSKLTIQTQPSSTATAGVAFATQPVIRVEDLNGNLVSTDNSTVVTATRSAGNGTLQGTTSMTAVNGLVTFTNLSHLYATNITIAFTSGALSSATSSQIAVSAGAFAKLQVLAPNQSSTPTASPGKSGTPIAHVSGTSFNVTVNAVDANWNLVNTATDTVGLTSSDGIAVLPSNTALVNGTATLPVTLKSVGSQSITASDITQPAKSADTSSGISITPATLTVVASNASRIYGQSNPSFGGTLTGVESGDNITATFASSATTNSSVGTYAIVPTLVDPNNRLGNYTVLSTNGTLTITKAALSVTASNASRQYGQVNPAFSGTLGSVQNNDNITASFASAATTNSTVGNYPITPILSDPGNKLLNYSVTTNAGTLTITNAALSVTANDALRVWGAPNPSFTGSFNSLLNNDNITANYQTTATTTTPVGTYPITFTLSDPNSRLTNYTVTTNNGTLTITNNPPNIDAIANQYAAAGSPMALQITASDPDQPYQTLSFSLGVLAPAGSSINPSTGVFTWTPPTGSEGTINPVTVIVTDNSIPSTSATNSFNVIVIDRPRLVSMNRSPDSSVSFLWTAYPGLNYHFQYKNQLTDASWTDLSQSTANSETVSVSDTPGSGVQRFYRLASDFSASDPAGVMPITFLGSSDSIVSLPLTPPPADSRPVSTVDSNVVTVSGATWTPGQFVYAQGVQSNTYYARFDSGALQGLTYNIVNNDTTTLTLDLGTDSLSAVATNDIVTVIPYWSLGSAFPNGDGINVSPTTGNRSTEILFPDQTTAGINLSAAKSYFFYNGSWRHLGQGGTYDDDIIPLNSSFIVRQNVTNTSTMTALGSVVVSSLTIGLRAEPTTHQDNALGLTRASTVTLNNSGLITSGAFQSSPLPGNRTDELLTFDNTQVAKNKSSSAVYYYWNSAWRRVGAGTNDVGNDPVLTPATGFIIRKATNATGVIWTNAP